MSGMVKQGVEPLPSVSYTMLSGGTVRVYLNSLSINGPHRRNGSDSTERCSTVNTGWGFRRFRLMGQRRTCLGMLFGSSGTASKLCLSWTHRVACLDDIGWIAVDNDP